MEIVTYWHRFIAPYIRARFGRGDRGAALVEYALLVGLIAVACIAAITILGNRTSDKFSSVGSRLA